MRFHPAEVEIDVFKSNPQVAWAHIGMGCTTHLWSRVYGALISPSRTLADAGIGLLFVLLVMCSHVATLNDFSMFLSSCALTP